MNYINEHSFQSIHLQSPPPARTNLMISESDGPASRSVDNVMFKVKQMHQAFVQVIDVMYPCFVHALLHKTSNK